MARSFALKAFGSLGFPRKCPEGRGGSTFDEVAAGLDEEGGGGRIAPDHAVDRVLSRMKLDPDVALRNRCPRA